MGTPNDVVSVDRLVRVITGTMADAFHYKESWPARCLAILERMSRELKPLLKTFGRPLDEELGLSMTLIPVGIVLIEWAYRVTVRYLVLLIAFFGKFNFVNS